MKINSLYRFVVIQLPLVLLSGCGNHMSAYYDMPTSFSSNGEKIYFTGISENGTSIKPYAGMFFSDHMARSCASCHGAHREGGIRVMPFFWVKSPPLTRQALFAKIDRDDGHGGHESYTNESLARAISQGIDSSDKPLSTAMPRWKMTKSDMHDLLTYLQQ